jgi:hypothetical protein
MCKSRRKEEVEFKALSDITNMKIKKFLVLSLFLAVALSGCLFKKTAMDMPAKDGSYNYENKDLGFSLTLPAEFIYFQTQRIDKEDYVDLEIFVPTSDVNFHQQAVPDYAKPIVIRMYKNKAAWEKLKADQEAAKLYEQLKSKGDKVYAIRYWSEIPNDWQGKWNDEMKKKIVDGFTLY